MKQDTKKYFLKTLGMGAVAGFRSMSAPAQLSKQLHNMPSEALKDSPLRYLQHGPVAIGLNLMSASEMMADKLPGIPDRISPPVLLARVGSGALVGATIFTANRDKWLKGAALGATAAVAATYGSYYLRMFMNKYAPNAVSGALEDALTLASGIAISKV
ncbi:DUF4126 family protein [Pontibacter chitinilyticus]|uniref:DUF4126 family protein n=1 Tax=Pontibacter chitinilyticus TaxID=2674989 RepID=UPI00321BADE8